MLDAHLADNSTVAFEADSVVTAQEVVDMVLNKKAVSDKSGYSVAIVCEGRGNVAGALVALPYSIRA